MDQIITLIKVLRQEVDTLRLLAKQSDSIMRSVGQFPLVGGKLGGGGVPRFRADIPIVDVKVYWEIQTRLAEKTARTAAAIELIPGLTDDRIESEPDAESDTPAKAPHSSEVQQELPNKEQSESEESPPSPSDPEPPRFRLP